MGKIILHVGFHKTASTSIQESFHHNRSLLRQQGIFYPEFFIDDKPIVNHSLILYTLFSNKPQSYKQIIRLGIPLDKVLASFLRQLEEQLSICNHDKLLLSAEDVSLLSTEELTRLKTFFHSHVFDLDIIGLIRSPESYLDSVLQQRIRSGGWLDDLAIGTVSKRISNLSSVFSSVSWASFETACDHKLGPVGYISDFLELSITEDFEFQASNSSLSNNATRLMSYLNQQFANLDEASNNTRFSRNVFRLVKTIEGPRFALTPCEREKYSDWLEQERSGLAGILEQPPEESTAAHLSGPGNTMTWTDAQIIHLASRMGSAGKDMTRFIKQFFTDVHPLDTKQFELLFPKH